MSQDDDYGFDDILEMAFEEIETPKTPPEGTYELEVISGKLRKGKGENGPAGEAFFPCKIVKAFDDVNEAALTAFGNDGIADSRVYFRIPMFERRDAWNVRRFVEKTLGASVNGATKLPEAVAQSKGLHFIGFVRHRQNTKDPEGPPLVDVTSSRAIGA